MTAATKDTILKKSKRLFAINGYEGFTMRTLAAECGVSLSSIYHFFEDKDVLLQHIYAETNTKLGIERSKLPQRNTASEIMMDRIIFQFKHVEDVVYVLKYYLHFRKQFRKNGSGFIPTKGYLHIEEVLRFGLEKRQFNISEEEIDQQAKVIAHAINGFLLEYFPSSPKASELEAVAQPIHEFIMRGLTNKEVKM